MKLMELMIRITFEFYRMIPGVLLKTADLVIFGEKRTMDHGKEDLHQRHLVLLSDGITR